MSPIRSEPRASEQGVALVAALFAMIILLGLAALFIATAINESRFTAHQRDFENALNTSEAGIDEVIVRLNSDRDFYGSPHDAAPTASGPTAVYDPAVITSEDAERQWAIAQAAPMSTVETGWGQTAAFRPEHVSYDPTHPDCVDTDEANDDPLICEPMKHIYAVGYIPSRAEAEEIRVVRVEYDQLLWSPDDAVAVDGNCNLNSGNVGGTLGDVYCDNDSATLSWGNTAKVEGKLTATGNVDPNPSIRGGSCLFSQPCANGTVGEFEEFATRKDLPEINVRDMYAFSKQGPPVTWYDLCPPGTPDTRATIRTSGPTPCTGSLVWTDGDTSSFNGWDFKGASNNWGGSSVTSGIYYVYQRNAGATGGVGTVSILTEADPADTTGSYSGSIDMRGNLDIEPGVPHLLFAADRDLSVNGNSGSTLEGLMAAHEQMALSGSAQLTGAAYAEDAPHTSASPVSSTVLTGGMTIDYNNKITLNLSGIVRITAWNEL